MEQETDKNFVKEYLLMVLASVLFSRLSFGMFLYPIPILFVVPRIRKTSNAVLLTLVTNIAVLIWNVVDHWETLSNPQNYGVVGFGLYLPVCLSVVSTVWVGLRDYSKLVLRKLVICSYSVLAIGVAFALWLCSEGGSEAFVCLQNTIQELIPAVFTEQMDSKLISDVFMTVIAVAIAPMGLIFGSFPVLISEFVLHKQDKEWQDNFSNMGMPQFYFWLTMVTWIAALTGTLFADYPTWLTIVVWNFAFCFGLYYLLTGISIVCSRIRKKVPEAKSSKICLMCMILALLPGANFIVVFGLPILGILETWINVR